MGSVQITEGSGTPIRTFSNAGVDSGARQQVVTLADDTGDLMSSRFIPGGTEDALLVRSMPAQVVKNGFSAAIASGMDTDWGTVVRTGSGQTISQSGGNLVIATGTTANSETIIRANSSVSGAIRVRCRSTLSQRIANQNFFVEMVDVLGDGLSATIGSSTAITVTFATNPFTSANVGQYMYLGGYSGSGTFIPGRYPIASISGNTVTYTVSGFATGSGTVCVFGWNHHHLLYNGTTTTTALWDTQRNGWNTGDTTVTINSTTSPGHIAVMNQNDMQASIADGLVASTAGIQYTIRGSRIENVPDDKVMRLQLRVVNGSTAPASTTTWSIGAVAVSNWSPQDVTIQDVRPMSPQSALPVQVANTPSMNVANSPTINIGAATRSAFNTVTSATAWQQSIKTSAGSLHELTVSNPTSTAAYVKLYNKASSVTIGTDVPVATFRLAAAGAVGDTLILNYGVNGKFFTLGMVMAITGGVAATDTTATVANIQVSGTYV